MSIMNLLKIFLSKLPSIKLNTLVYEEDNEWVAHCLQLDLVTTGPDQDTVVKDIEDLVVAQIKFAYENNNLANLFKPAPSEEWEKLQHATLISSKKLKIKIDRKELATHTLPINELELSLA